jgi:S1-C subfamily serine protease
VKFHDSGLGAARLARGNDAYLGTRQSYGGEVKGVTLDFIAERSPAEKGGLKVGDIIVKFDGKPVASIDDFLAGLERHKPGDGVEIVVQRDGQQSSLKVTLGSQSSD